MDTTVNDVYPRLGLALRDERLLPPPHPPCVGSPATGVSRTQFHTIKIILTLIVVISIFNSTRQSRYSFYHIMDISRNIFINGVQK